MLSSEVRLNRNRNCQKLLVIKNNNIVNIFTAPRRAGASTATLSQLRPGFFSPTILEEWSPTNSGMHIINLSLYLLRCI